MHVSLAFPAILLLTACGGTPSGAPFQVVSVTVNDRNAIPAGSTIPVDAQFKLSSVVEFNAPVSQQTLVSPLTANYRLNGASVAGVFQFPSPQVAVFFSDERQSDIAETCPSGQTNIDVVIRGRNGQITDGNGRVWPFSGVHAVTQGSSGPTASSPLLLGPLLDGDRNDEPGGDFRQDWSIVC